MHKDFSAETRSISQKRQSFNENLIYSITILVSRYFSKEVRPSHKMAFL